MEVEAYVEVRLIKASKRAAKASRKGKKLPHGQKAADLWRGMKKVDGLDSTCVYGALASHTLANRT